MDWLLDDIKGLLFILWGVKKQGKYVIFRMSLSVKMLTGALTGELM